MALTVLKFWKRSNFCIKSDYMISNGANSYGLLVYKWGARATWSQKGSRVYFFLLKEFILPFNNKKIHYFQNRRIKFNGPLDIYFLKMIEYDAAFGFKRLCYLLNIVKSWSFMGISWLAKAKSMSSKSDDFLFYLLLLFSGLILCYK